MKIHLLVLIICYGLFPDTYGSIAMDLEEELPSGIVILDLYERLQLWRSGFQNVKFQVVDQFLNLNGNPRQTVEWIDVDSNSGIVKQRRRVDRDTLCRDAQDCFIVLKVVVHLPAAPRPETINFHLVDVNDNTPSFPSKVVDLSIAETSLVGKEVNLDHLQATDPDKGRNATLTYSLVPPSDYFNISHSTDVSGFSHLRLVVARPLDYEADKLHRLILRASDGGIPHRSSTMNLRIEIEDENDNKPVFDQTEYSVKLREDAPIGQTIVVVHATDGDGGVRGQVHYVIPDNFAESQRDSKSAGSTTATRKYPVTVDRNTGAVHLEGKLNYKIHNELKIFIEAVDGDEENPRRGRALLILQVQDVNDNAPVITVNYITNSVGSTGYVSEDASVGTYLAYITVTDADEGMNGDVTMSVETVVGEREDKKGNYTEMGKFLITDEDLLTTGIQFDREKQGRYDVMIRATDKGVPPKSSATAITIIILDVNEYAPKFLHSDLVFDLPEDLEIGSVITQARATDLDATKPPSWRLSEDDEVEPSLNGEIIYGVTLAEVDDDTDDVLPVRIEPSSGAITLIRSLDYESRKLWKLTITARDGGHPTALQSTCKLEIRVENVNDNTPTFVSPKKDNSTVYASTVSSNNTFTTIKAIDFGVDEETQLRYSFQIVEKDGRAPYHYDYYNLFDLDKVTGQFSIDTEHRSDPSDLGRYKMKISVSDSGNPPQVTSMTLYVNVIDTPVSDAPNQDGLSGDDEEGSTMILIVAGAVGAVVVILVIVIVAVVCAKKRKARKERSCETDEARQTLSASSHVEDDSNLTDRTRVAHHGSLRCGEKVHENSLEISPTNRTSANAAHDRMDRYCEATDSQKENKTFIEVQKMHSIENRKKLPPLIPPSRTSRDVSLNCRNLNREDYNPTSDFGKQCTELCITHGHSDTCWMPLEGDPLLSSKSQSVAAWQSKTEPRRKDSVCSIDTSSSNISYYKLNKHDKRNREDMFVGNDVTMDDVIGKPRTLTGSDGSSMMSSNASSGTSGHFSNDIIQSPKIRSRDKTLRHSLSDSRGDRLSLSRHNHIIQSQSTRC